MSDTNRSPKNKSSIAVFEDFPQHYSLKSQLRSSEDSETWEVFDRSKKKKLILKRFRGPSISDIFYERLLSNLLQWELVCPEKTLLPAIISVGRDENGIFYLREPVVGKSLFEIVSQGKLLKEHEAAKKFGLLTQLLIPLHQGNLFHHNLKPSNIFFSGLDDVAFVDLDFGHLLDPSLNGEGYQPLRFGPNPFLAPEQLAGVSSGKVLDARTDIWGLGASLAFALTGKTPAELHDLSISAHFDGLISWTLKEAPTDRIGTPAEFLAELERIARTTRPSAFTSSVETKQESKAPPAPSAAPIVGAPEREVSTPTQIPAPASVPSVAVPSASVPSQPTSSQPEIRHAADSAMPQGIACPQCHAPVRSAADRLCPQCGRHFFEPCLNCQSMSPFWTRTCRGCGADLSALKHKMLATLNGHKQQILKFRESYGHDKTLPLLKFLSTVNHPDFVSFREWAKSMITLIQKERRDIRNYLDNVRAQANAAMEAQKYDKVQQILEQVPRPLLDEPLRKQYVEAGDALTEVDSLVREIRNAIATKQYSPLLSCVQRYLELKANDPEAKNLQQKIEKLTTITASNGMKMRRIPSGRFYMGSHDTDEFLRNNEHPQHRVQITHSLFVGVYLVTQSDFLSLMEFNPSTAKEEERCPVDSVTWFSAIEFCNKMSDMEGLPHYCELTKIKRRSNGSIESAEVAILGGDGYRLLSEAEWEYTCRAGSITPWCFGDLVVEVGDYAWFFNNSAMETHPVGSRKPNSWGLYDMHGNVMEWCHDWYGEFYYQQCPDEEENPPGPEEGMGRVLRGGAWQFGAEATRSAYRNSSVPETTSNVIGFRVCRNATDEAIR